jgi:hypothetical protein
MRRIQLAAKQRAADEITPADGLTVSPKARKPAPKGKARPAAKTAAKKARR